MTDADYKKALDVCDFKVKLVLKQRDWWRKRSEELIDAIKELIKKKADSDEIERHFRYRI